MIVIKINIILKVVILGDEILEVNGKSLEGLTHQQAISNFKHIRSGTMLLTVRPRQPSPQNR